MGAQPKRKISTRRKGKRRQEVQRKFDVKVASKKSQTERILKNQ